MSVTSKTEADKYKVQSEAFYVMKDQTRVAGPWSDQDYEEIRPEFQSVKLIKENGLYPWQQSLLDEVSSFSFRKIDVVIDTEGNNGKSMLDDWIYHNRMGQFVPATLDANGMAQYVASFKPAKLYVIDMPRAMKKKALFQMYTAIEMLKDGKVYDTRYKGKEVRFERPRIIVFTNTPPKVRYLSKDRWNFWTIKDKELVEFKYKKANKDAESED